MRSHEAYCAGMRLARYSTPEGPALAVVERGPEGDQVVLVDSAPWGDTDDWGVVFDAADGVPDLTEAVASGRRLPLDENRLLAPVARPPEFLAIGLNYRAHALEGGREVPKVPVVFNKQSSCVNSPRGQVHIPAPAPDKVDYEGELGVVIGRRCHRVPAARASEVIAGYVVVHDVSVRDWQFRTPTMTMGKSWDTHGPVGPWIVTTDELVDPHVLELTTKVNGEVRQHSNTDDLIFDIWWLIEHLSTAFTLMPGTIITTGTPSGVGVFSDPPRFLAPGDVVEIEVEGIGRLVNPVVAEPPTAPLIGRS